MFELNKGKTRAIMPINDFANICGYFFNACLDQEENFCCNNGYNCRHVEQEEKNVNPKTGHEVGKCYAWSCPFGWEADEKDCEEFGWDYEEDDFIVTENPEIINKLID